MANKQYVRYFAASNSADGFVNYFSRIFGGGRCRRLYVIKGGPGTGKSYFMDRVAREAESKGLEVTYYYCSSDPDSLDGIFIDGIRVGLVDGTAPHVWEPGLIGAFEQLVDLGAFWDADRLIARRGEIEALTEAKKRSYQEAYGYLGAYGAVKRAMEPQLRGVVDLEKLSRAAERLIARSGGASAAPVEQIAVCSSVGMKGYVHFDTCEQRANTLYAVKDFCGTAHLFLEALLNCGRQKGLRMCVVPHPILPERPEALVLTDNGLTVSACAEEGDHVINMRRFVKEQESKALRIYRKERNEVCERLLSCAADAFGDVRRHHFALEHLFTDAMDFSAKEQFTSAFCTKLFSEF